MDIQLPVLDGYEIKALPGLAAIPIIAVSFFAMKGDQERACLRLRRLCDQTMQPVDLLRLVRR